MSMSSNYIIKLGHKVHSNHIVLANLEDLPPINTWAVWWNRSIFMFIQNGSVEGYYSDSNWHHHFPGVMYSNKPKWVTSVDMSDGRDQSHRVFPAISTRWVSTPNRHLIWICQCNQSARQRRFFMTSDSEENMEKPSKKMYIYIYLN